MSYADFISFAKGGVFQCRPGCTEGCSLDNCPAHQRAFKYFEDVVQRLEEAEKSVMELMDQNQVLREARKNWRAERAELIKLLPVETARQLPGPSRSPTSPATKRRAHSPLRAVSKKRPRIETPSASLQHGPTPAPVAPTPTPVAPTPTPVAANACPCQEAWSTQRPDPEQGLFEEVVEELRRDYHGAVLSSQVPLHSSRQMEDYLNNLWATARSVTKHDRRKVVTNAPIHMLGIVLHYCFKAHSCCSKPPVWKFFVNTACAYNENETEFHFFTPLGGAAAATARTTFARLKLEKNDYCYWQLHKAFNECLMCKQVESISSKIPKKTMQKSQDGHEIDS
ncbi:hypothetical protein CEXT_624351 [Caerostris extrusa]|uniref:Transposase n=1 Tax=Caerostris extrusa TaxID=172846 RepID=A0AAV4TCI5_CAEEX|nr:hypothetical protein CEXT_624351 [Caerostris extrusa]